MRILFTTHQGNLAGSTLSVSYLAKGLAKKGHEIHIACKRETLLWEMLSDMPNVTCHHVPFSSYVDFRSCMLLRKIVHEEDIEVVSAQGGKDRNLTIVTKWLFLRNIELVFTRRQRPRNEPWIKRWFHLRGADAIVMISEGLKDIFVRKGYPQGQLIVIRNGVPSELLDSVTDEQVNSLRLKYAIGDQVVIGCVSRKKSQEQLINALRYLPENWLVLFVGIEESEVNWGEVEERPTQKMIFTGQVSHQEALCHFPLLDVNILPSHLDGFGLVLVEAMLFRVAVIGSHFGGIPDVIQDGENGFLFQNGNAKELAEKIKRLISDNLLRNRLVDEADRHAREKFTMSRVVDEYEELFYSLIASR